MKSLRLLVLVDDSRSHPWTKTSASLRLTSTTTVNPTLSGLRHTCSILPDSFWSGRF